MGLNEKTESGRWKTVRRCVRNQTMDEETDPVREHAHEVAESFLEKGDDYGWFEALYAEAEGNNEHIPWADLAPNRFLVEWERDSPLAGKGKTALVVGCGLGDDANFLANRGFDVMAFDVSETAIDWARKLYPSQKIRFLQADLFDAPPEWAGAFDLVLEIYTIQALPLHLRERAVSAICGFVAPGGTLVAVSRFREDDKEPEGPPWALTRADISAIAASGVALDEFSEFDDAEDGITRFVASFTRVLA
jgi:SAM-dependent methyltransferase